MTASSTTPAPQPTSTRPVELYAVEFPNLDTICYRGSARASDLARISQPDVFDQVTNPNGLQRGLSPRHASDAYNYANREADREFPRAFPEVILNVRDSNVLDLDRITTGRQRRITAYKLGFDMNAIADDVRAGKIAVSRVDGNHRLFYADGDERNRNPLDKVIPFQIHVGLTPEQEANLFVDVNSNQKGLNSSHLHVMRARLTPEEQALRDNPEAVFARRLAEDPESSWNGLVFMGGSRAGSRQAGIERPVSFVTLEGGVKRTLTKSQYIHDLSSPDAQYVLIRNFWNAMREVFREEWTDPKNFLILRNLGVLSFSIFAGTVIDRCMARGSVDMDTMRSYIEQAKDAFDWHKDARGERSVSGMSGNRAALIIAGELASDLTDPGESAIVQTIQEQLLQEVEHDGEGSEQPQGQEADLKISA